VRANRAPRREERTGQRSSGTKAEADVWSYRRKKVGGIKEREGLHSVRGKTISAQKAQDRGRGKKRKDHRDIGRVKE